MKARLPSPDFAVFLGGLLLFAAGLYLVYPPAALIGSGCVLMAVALFGGKA